MSNIEVAVQQRHPVTANYNGVSRRFEPHVLGVSTTGKKLVRAFQKEPEKGWRLFEVDALGDVEVSADYFMPRLLEGYNADDPAMTQIIAKI